jgi:hypothetical protein
MSTVKELFDQDVKHNVKSAKGGEQSTNRFNSSNPDFSKIQTFGTNRKHYETIM